MVFNAFIGINIYNYVYYANKNPNTIVTDHTGCIYSTDFDSARRGGNATCGYHLAKRMSAGLFEAAPQPRQTVLCTYCVHR